MFCALPPAQLSPPLGAVTVRLDVLVVAETVALGAEALPAASLAVTR